MSAYLQREAAGVDHFADQASRYAENAGRLEPLERVRDRLTAKPCGRLQDRVRRRAEAVRAAYEAQDKDTKDSQAYLAHNAVASSWRSCAAFQGFGKGKDSGSLVSIERPAMLARIGNKPRAAAKAISHGCFSQALPLGCAQASRQRSQKWLAFEGESGEEKSCHAILISPVFPVASPLRAGFCVLRTTLHTDSISRDYHDLQLLHMLGQALFTAMSCGQRKRTRTSKRTEDVSCHQYLI